jgi:hypothetical protein
MDDTAAMRRQRAQHMKRLRPHPEFGAVAEQAIGRNVDGEGPEGEVRHAIDDGRCAIDGFIDRLVD